MSRAYSGYIEYVGAKLSATRPGPPKACSSCSITSLEPFAAHTCSTRTPCGVSRERYAASAPRSSTNSRSGYRFRLPAVAATASAMSATQAAEGP